MAAYGVYPLYRDTHISTLVDSFKYTIFNYYYNNGMMVGIWECHDLKDVKTRDVLKNNEDEGMYVRAQ